MVGDSQISLKKCRRRVLAAILLAVSCRLAMLSSLLCPETDRNIRIGKQGYVFILSDSKRLCFEVSFLTSISVSTVILTLGKVEFFK